MFAAARIFSGVLLLIAILALMAPGWNAGRLLYSDSFTHGLGLWSAEWEKPGKVVADHGKLDIDVPAGMTLWFRPELQGAVMIEYEATMVQADGANDRVSDLNCFWMATDARSPGDFFAVKRSGAFVDYNQLRTYYVGQGGNSNTTTRFRRYIGDLSLRPLLPEHDLHDGAVLLRPNTPRRIRLIAAGKRIQYYCGDQLIFDFTDALPYTHGHFGLRTTDSHIEIRDFRVYRVTLH